LFFSPQLSAMERPNAKSAAVDFRQDVERWVFAECLAARIHSANSGCTNRSGLGTCRSFGRLVATFVTP